MCSGGCKTGHAQWKREQVILFPGQQLDCNAWLLPSGIRKSDGSTWSPTLRRAAVHALWKSLISGRDSKGCWEQRGRHGQQEGEKKTQEIEQPACISLWLFRFIKERKSIPQKATSKTPDWSVHKKQRQCYKQYWSWENTQLFSSFSGQQRSAWCFSPSTSERSMILCSRKKAWCPWTWETAYLPLEWFVLS